MKVFYRILKILAVLIIVSHDSLYFCFIPYAGYGCRYYSKISQ